jgi:hypothetical protein
MGLGFRFYALIRSEKAEMFLYSENFALKGPNETISFLDFYIKKSFTKVEKLFIFSDNCFSQNKNRFIWLYYLSLLKNGILEEITLIYPTPGHSFLDCDRDFGRIEKNRLKVEKVSFPSQWVDLIEKTDKKFNINYVNHPLTDDLKPDGKPIIIVKDYKKFFDRFLVSSVEKLSQIRKIKFTKNGIFATTKLLSENFELNLNLIKSDLNIENFDFNTLNNAYESYLPIKKSKFNDVKNLLRYVLIPENVKFYDSLYFCDSDLIVSKSKSKIDLALENKSNFHCICKSKCIRLCECKKIGLKCNENCMCNAIECKNRP